MNAEEYRKKNPLGGPAKMFDAIADRIRAGEEYHAVLRDYNLLMLDPNRNSQPCPSCGARIEIGYRDSALRHWAKRWIPVAESLPDDDLTVLVALADGEVWPAFMDGEQWRYVTADAIEDAEVTHWMNMPEPPK